MVLATLALMIVVGLYNRPSWAVAPRFRHYPGALEEWQKKEGDGDQRKETPL